MENAEKDCLNNVRYEKAGARPSQILKDQPRKMISSTIGGSISVDTAHRIEYWEIPDESIISVYWSIADGIMHKSLP